MKSAEERKKYDENAMCKAYGKRMMFMSIPFIAGMIMDIWHIGIGCLIAWVIWFVMFIMLLIDRHKIEIDVNERAVFIRTQGCFFVYTNSDCFLNSLWNRLKGSIICSILFLTLQWQ